MLEGGRNDDDGIDENTASERGEIQTGLGEGDGDNFPLPPSDQQICDDVPLVGGNPNSNVTVQSWTNSTIEVSWIHEDNNTEYYEITATCVLAADPCKNGTETVSENERSGTVYDLTAGAEYEIIVTAFNAIGKGNPSAPVNKRTDPNPVRLFRVISPDRSTNSIQGSWATPDGLISSYRIVCNSSTGGNPHLVRNLDPDITEYNCTGLSAGHLYTMTVYTVSGTGNDDDRLESEPASEDKRVYPNTVVALGISSPGRSTNSIQGSWSRPDGLISSYRIECISSTGGTPHLAEDLDSDITEYNCTGLSAGHLYTMSVYTVSGTGNDDDKLESEPASGDKRVYPNTVGAFDVSSPDRSTNSIQGTWTIPDGLMSSYTIECISSTGGYPHLAEDLDSDITGYNCTGLSAGHLYTMSVYTVSGTGNDYDKLESEPASEDKRVYPNTVVALEVSSPGRSTNVTQGSWSRPDGLISSYRIECISSTGGTPHLVEDLDPDITEYNCTGLSAGHLYTMSVYTVSGTGNDDDKLESEPASEDKRVYPNTVVALGVSSPRSSTNYIRGSWSRPDGLISSYRIECISSTGGTPHLAEDLNSDVTVYNCTGLSAGHLYTMSVYTVSGTGNDDERLESEPASEDKRVYPNTAGALNVTSPDRSTNFIQGSWTKPEGLMSSYRIECISSTGGSPHHRENLHPSSTGYSCTGLTAGHLYTMSVYTVSGTGNNDDKLESEPASEDKRVYPNTVVALGVSSPGRSTNSIQGSWSRPDGLISSYRIECISSTGGNPHLAEDLDSEITGYACTGLSAGHLYTMSVYTVSGTGNNDDKLESEPASEDKRVYPSTVGAFDVTSPGRSRNVIQGSWTIPDGLISSFRIECISSTGGDPHLAENLHPSSTGYACTGLTAGHLYTMSVYTVSGTGNDDDKLESEPASEDKRVYPNTVVAFGVSSPGRSTNSIQGSWSIPDGLISSYRIECISSTGGNPHHRDNLHHSSTGYSCTGLTAGHLYTMSVYTVSGTGNNDDKLESEPASEDKRVYPNTVLWLSVTSPGKSTNSMRGTWTIPDGLISSYRIECIGSTGGNPHYAEDQNSGITEYTCTGLSAGHLYTMSVYTVSGTGNDYDKLESEPASEDKRVYPYTVVAFGVSLPGRSTNSIQGMWTIPDGLISSYRIECISSTGGDEHHAENLDSGITEYMCTGLSAGHQYTMSVYTVSGTGNDDDKLESEPASGDQRVYPNTVRLFSVTSPDRSTNSIEGSWTRPDGLISSYRIVCNSSTGGNPHHVRDLDSDITGYVCTGLSAGHLYTMSVYTVSGTGNDDDKLESEPASEDKRVCK
ncbi:receptor-type tyrosine-protein phosphatase beta-like [Ptychodera flava]|uniref:receptor-type tyrosine-protein phosphatase beta-like n=1 Tax=Ptychodera flava TaxID=63121 RepID=UPI00396A2614